MEFDRALVLAKARPGEERQAQIDGGRVEGIDRMRQFQTEAVLGVELAGCLDQAEGKIPDTLGRKRPVKTLSLHAGTFRNGCHALGFSNLP